MLRACARCWSACPTSSWSVSPTGRCGFASRSGSTVSGPFVRAAERCIVTVSARSCWSICRCSAARPGWCGASNAGLAPGVGAAGATGPGCVRSPRDRRATHRRRGSTPCSYVARSRAPSARRSSARAATESGTAATTTRRGCARSRTPPPSVKLNAAPSRGSRGGCTPVGDAARGLASVSLRAHGLPTNCPQRDDTSQHQSDGRTAKPQLRARATTRYNTTRTVQAALVIMRSWVRFPHPAPIKDPG